PQTTTLLPTLPQFDNQPVIRTGETATFFGKIAHVPGATADSEEDTDYVEFCTNLDTTSIIDSDWEERAVDSKLERSDSKSFQGDGQFIGTVTCASTNGEICIREEATKSETAIFINEPVGLLCRCTSSGCSVGTFGFGDGGAEDQLTDVVYVGCGPCHISPTTVASSPSQPPAHSSEEILESFGPAAHGQLPEALPFDALPDAFVPFVAAAPAPALPQQPLPIAPSSRFNPHLTIVQARSRAAPTVDNIAAVNAEKPSDGFLVKIPHTNVCTGFSSRAVTAEADWAEQKHPSETVSFSKGTDLYLHTAVLGTLTCWDTGAWQSCITGKRANGTIGSFESAPYTSTLLECRCTRPNSCHIVSIGFEPDSSNQFIDVTRIACGKC
uniref:Uncharacterized protein n=1 Tax=Plectus sambesii TaxID=2011161 RepID=A0A914UQ63_9BILA